MSAEEIQVWLDDGIAAANAGKRAEARELLLRVVNADENNVQGWLWLSGVVTTLEDREMCLQNVLTLDPGNEAAQHGLELVRAQIAETPEIEPESDLPQVGAGAPAQPSLDSRVSVDFGDGEFIDPLLCVYCAHLTREEDQDCPNCKHKLYHRFYEREKPRWLWVGWAVNMAEAIFMTASLAVWLGIVASALSIAQARGSAVDFGQLLSLYLGQPVTLAPHIQRLVLESLPREQMYVRIGFILADVFIAFGLLTRKRIFHILYIASLAVAAVLLYFNVTASRVTMVAATPDSPLEGILQVAVNEALGVFGLVMGLLFGLFLLIKLLLAFIMEDDFATKTERLWCLIDASVRDPNGAFIRAKSYMKRGMWTLAALYLQRAVSIQPNTPEYYIALAECYAQLKLYPRSLHLLDQAERLEPDSPVILNMRGIIMELNVRDNPTSAGSV
jgi:tetratricopeptide (TPR) repeat protein